MNVIAHWLQVARTYVWAILSCVLGVVLLKQVGIWPYLSSLYQSLIPIFIGFIFAFLLEHFITRLEKNMKRFFACTIVYGSGIVVMGAIIVMIGNPLYEQLQVFLSYVPDIIAYVEELFQDKVQPVVASVTPLNDFMSQGYTFAIDKIVGVSTTLNRIVFGYLAGYFISLDKDLFFHIFRRMRLKNEKQLIRFAKTCSNVMSKYLSGLSLDILFLFAAFLIAFFMLKFPSPLLYAMVLSILNLLPYIGPMIGLLIVLMVSLVTYTNPWVVILIIWVIQQVEANYVQHLIFKKTMDLRPILTLTMMFVGSAWFGILGMIMAPIFAAIAQIVFRSYIVSSKIETVGSWDEVWYNIYDIEIDDEDE